MGNSSTSRYADGRELYHPQSEVQRWLRGLARGAPPRGDQELRDAIVAAAHKNPRLVWARTQASLRRAPTPVHHSVRRHGGEVVRVLMDPGSGPQIRRLSQRFRHDEGDVAALWVATTAVTPTEPRIEEPTSEAEPA